MAEAQPAGTGSPDPARSDTTDAVDEIDEAAFVAALASSPRRALSAATVALARAELDDAKVRPDPSIGYEREEPFVDGRGTPTNYLRITLPFDLSGARGRRIAGATAALEAATHDFAGAELERVNAALRVFDATARARRQLELLGEARGLLVRAVEIARQRGKAGDAAGYQVQRFEVELSAHDDEIATAALELRGLRLQLAALAGRPGLLDARASFDLPTPPALDSLLAKATGRGDLRAAQLRSQAAAHRIAAADRGWVPQPSVMLGAMTADLGDQTGTGYVAGLSLTIPVFDRGRAERARATAERALASSQTRALEREIPTAIRVAHAALVARIEQVKKLEGDQLGRLDGILRAVETAYREGNASVVELLDAHRAAREIRVRALELRSQVARDKRELELAVGQRL